MRLSLTFTFSMGS